MAYFHLYVFDRDSRAVQSFDLIGHDRAVASRRARQEMTAAGGVACEVWQSQLSGQGKRTWSLAYQHRLDETASGHAAGVRLSGTRER
jgi:hypothetical protein